MKSAIEELLDVLKDPSQAIPLVRLSEFSDLDRTEFGLLEGAWPQIPVDRRRTVVEEVGQLADLHFEFVFERLNRLALGDPDPRVRVVAINNLWECEDPEHGAALLSALLNDPSAEVRTAAAAALGHYVYLGEVDEVPERFLHEIEDALLATVGAEPDGDLRRRALESLGYSSRGEVDPLIEQAYASDSPEVKRSAVLAMGRSANDAWQDRVLAELDSPIPQLREEAARAAGELELQAATQTLVELLDDVNPRVRQAAVWSLGQIGGSLAAEALQDLLERAEDEEEGALLEDALDHLAFVDSTRDMLLFDFEDPEDSSG